MTAMTATMLGPISVPFGSGRACGTLAARLAIVAPRDRAATLVEAVLDGETLRLAGADLRGLDLSPWQKGAATLVLDGADFTGATLSGANFGGASLRGACLDGALLVGARLQGVDLRGASLRGAHLTGTDLSRSDISEADFRGASLLNADLTLATASGAVFSEALLQSTVFDGAVLRTADLRWAHLVNARLIGADLSGARFEGAVLSLARLDRAQISPSTDFSYAFLYQACLGDLPLRRAHLKGGVGEAVSDLALARDAYRGLKHHFAQRGRSADARWAHVMQQRMATATHRPDRAARYHRPSWPLWFQLRHGLRWVMGGVAELLTGYGISFARAMGTLAATWLVFAWMFSLSGAVINARGAAVRPVDLLLFSAAQLTPIDAYPLATTTRAGLVASAVESMMGICLLGALGHMLALRLNSD